MGLRILHIGLKGFFLDIIGESPVIPWQSG